jgi:hypothetical protein
MDKSWKQLERAIAHKFGTERTPLSGRNSRHTRSDTLSKSFYIEVKSLSRLPFWKKFQEARSRARQEGKKPLLAFHKKGYPGTVVMMDLDDFIEQK